MELLCIRYVLHGQQSYLQIFTRDSYMLSAS